MIQKRLEFLKERVNQAAQKTGRSLNDIEIVCVTKQARLEDVSMLIKAGCFQIAENRLQKAVEKKDFLKHTLSEDDFLRLRWHLVGHLQTNKVSKAVKMFQLIQSVDSLRLASLISEQSQKLKKKIDILVQINISGEDSKFGVDFEQAKEIIPQTMKLPGLNLKGLMGIGPFIDDLDQIRLCFRRLREFYDQENKMLLLNFKAEMSILSMGMSDDFEIAIEEGSTMIRVGRTIFGG
ncbi:MAG: YggS family pyridoxal phosphate-dependent enzyme [Candidatus Omnitrophota bacterium]